MITRKNRKGFTLAELMLVVAIIIVLASLAFVGVTRYLRGLRLLEMDNAAKEMYFAAQNRITAALVSGDLGRLEYAPEKYDEEKTLRVDGEDVKLHVLVVPADDSTKPTLLNLLLPFGSIDETIRGGGSYIITYTFDAENNLADVWDVWYTAEWRGVKHEFKRDEVADLYQNTRGDTNKDTRKNYGSNKAVIGHYGSKGVSITRNKLAVTLELINDEVLYLKGKVTVDDKPDVPISNVVNPQVNIIVEGKTSGAVRTLMPSKSGVTVKADDGSFSFVLDDITTEKKRFRDQFSEVDEGSSAFIFGEDIRVTVEVYSNDTLANIDRATAVDNSLFQYVNTKADGGKIEAGIGKVRHLQNLSSDVSNVDYNNDKLKINKALQTDDLLWDNEGQTAGFVNFKLDGSTPLGGNIYYNDGGATAKHTDNSFLPINIKTIFEYDAGYELTTGTPPVTENKRHSISNLVVSGAEHAGLFGTVRTPTGTPLAEGNILLTVQNLEMNGANISGVQTAGAIIANEVNAARLSNISINAATVQATDGNVGGAVGKAANGLDLFGVNLTGKSSVTATGGNAGGLLGDFNATDTNSHLSINALIDSSGTEKKVINYSSVGDKDSDAITVSSTGENMAAGGLVGAITKGYPQIDNSFSTALVSGYTAGGLIGAVGSSCNANSYVNSCYVGGHVINDTTSGMPVYDDANFNVTGTNIAGGFIGTSATGNLAVSNSYTTASTKSTAAAGGFYGSGAEIKISNCYATGLVNATDPTKAGAFSGTAAVSLTAPNYYFELVNPAKSAVVVAAGQSQPAGVSAVESSFDSYTSFFMLRAENTFFPYNDSDGTNITSLKKMFGSRYFLPTVKDLNTNAVLNFHVGDWQPVDTLVTNTPSGG